MDEERPGLHPADPAGEAHDNRLIGDRRFMDQLEKIFELKNFLVQEQVVLTPEQLTGVDLGPLNNFEFGGGGRKPTDHQWKLLDEKFRNVASCLDDELRRRFKIRHLKICRLGIFTSLPVVFLLIVAFTMVAYAVNNHWAWVGPDPCTEVGQVKIFRVDIFTLRSFFFQKEHKDCSPHPATFWYDLSYLSIKILWSIAQGGLGACAYLAVQASAKNGPGATRHNLFRESIELTDVNVKIRIILGSLFGFVLGIAVCTPGLEAVIKTLRNESVNATEYPLIVAPFLLGFSTSLVLAILERLVVSVRIFFGIASSADRP